MGSRGENRVRKKERGRAGGPCGRTVRKALGKWEVRAEVARKYGEDLTARKAGKIQKVRANLMHRPYQFSLLKPCSASHIVKTYSSKHNRKQTIENNETKAVYSVVELSVAPQQNDSYPILYRFVCPLSLFD